MDTVADIVSGRSFCDLGCSRGDVLELACCAGASRVAGVESDPKKVAVARSRGFDVLLGDYRVCKLPTAEVFYVWHGNGRIIRRVLRRLTTEDSCSVARYLLVGADGTRRIEVKKLFDISTAWPSTIRYFEFDEPGAPDEPDATIHMDRLKGKFYVGVFYLDVARREKKWPV